MHLVPVHVPPHAPDPHVQGPLLVHDVFIVVCLLTRVPPHAPDPHVQGPLLVHDAFYCGVSSDTCAAKQGLLLVHDAFYCGVSSDTCDAFYCGASLVLNACGADTCDAFYCGVSLVLNAWGTDTCAASCAPDSHVQGLLPVHNGFSQGCVIRSFGAFNTVKYALNMIRRITQILRMTSLFSV